MKSAVDVDDAAVQQMVEESVEHAFEDLAARRWIEAKLKAEQLIAATRKALTDCSSELEAEYRQRVERALNEVQAVVAARNGPSQTGDTATLQTVCAALDEATRPMADYLMDKAMEAMLRKRGVIQ